jgi:hypothetical protein
VSHCKSGYLRGFFHRVKARRGWAKAIVATSHKILVIAFQILKNSTPYVELGGDYFDRLNPASEVFDLKPTSHLATRRNQSLAKSVE